MPGGVHVHVNHATSLDGAWADAAGRPVRFSSPEDMQRVHTLRARLDAILVGAQTVINDDPSLRVKLALADGNDPLRVVVDPSGRIPEGARVLDGGAPTLVLHGGVERTWGAAGDLAIPMRGGRMAVTDILAAVSTAGARSLLVEGGPRTAAAFLAQRWDAWTWYMAPWRQGAGPRLKVPVQGCRGRVERLGEGALWTFSPAT